LLDGFGFGAGAIFFCFGLFLFTLRFLCVIFANLVGLVGLAGTGFFMTGSGLGSGFFSMGFSSLLDINFSRSLSKDAVFERLGIMRLILFFGIRSSTFAFRTNIFSPPRSIFILSFLPSGEYNLNESFFTWFPSSIA